MPPPVPNKIASINYEHARLAPVHAKILYFYTILCPITPTLNQPHKLHGINLYREVYDFISALKPNYRNFSSTDKFLGVSSPRTATNEFQTLTRSD